MPSCQQIHDLIQQHCSIDPRSQACIQAIEMCHIKGCMDCPPLPPEAQAITKQRSEPLTFEQAMDKLLQTLSDEVIRLREQVQQLQEQ